MNIFHIVQKIEDYKVNVWSLAPTSVSFKSNKYVAMGNESNTLGLFAFCLYMENVKEKGCLTIRVKFLSGHHGGQFMRNKMMWYRWKGHIGLNNQEKKNYLKKYGSYWILERKAQHQLNK